MKRYLIPILLLFWAGVASADTLSVLRTRIRTVLNESTASQWTDDQITAAINDGTALIEATINATQMETTYACVSGTFKYILPADFWLAEGAYIRKNVAASSGQWQEVRPLKHKRKKDMGTTQAERGDPVQEYSIWGDSVAFWPVPSAKDLITVEYSAISSPISADGTESPLDPPLEVLMQFYARSIMWDRFNDGRAQPSLEFFMSMLGAIKANRDQAQKTKVESPMKGVEPTNIANPAEP